MDCGFEFGFFDLFLFELLRFALLFLLLLLSLFADDFDSIVADADADDNLLPFRAFLLRVAMNSADDDVCIDVE